MRINCPSCKAGYEVPDALLGAAPRRVRCARCAHEWTPDGPPVAAAVVIPTPEELPPEPEPAARPVLPRPLPVPRADSFPPPALRGRPQQGSVLSSLAVVGLSVVALAALAWAVYLWRAELMLAWPPSQRLFAVLGLH